MKTKPLNIAHLSISLFLSVTLVLLTTPCLGQAQARSQNLPNVSGVASDTPMPLTDWTKQIPPAPKPNAVAECQAAPIPPWLIRTIAVCILAGGVWVCHKIKQWCDKYLGQGTNPPTAGPGTNTNNMAFSPMSLSAPSADAISINGKTISCGPDYDSNPNSPTLVGYTSDGSPIVVAFEQVTNVAGASEGYYLEERIRVSTNAVSYSDALTLKIWMDNGGSVRAELWDTNGNLLMTTTTPYAESNGNLSINFGTNDVFDLMYTNKQKAAFLYMVPGANNMITTNGPITNEPTLALPPKQ